jgi:hypothetical protein
VHNWPRPIGWGGHGWDHDHPWRFIWGLPVIFDPINNIYDLNGASIGDPDTVEDYINQLASFYEIIVLQFSTGSDDNGDPVVFWTIRGTDYAIETFCDQLNAAFPPFQF